MADWTRLAGELAALITALESVPQPLAQDPDLVDLVRQLRSPDVRLGIDTAVADLRAVATRLSRDTVNIGVSGQARVGKSTVLQSMSGLTDEQIPTGSGLPVTAVRSRIHHSDTRCHAVLGMHTFDSFVSEVLRPYHDALGIVDLPLDGDSFARLRYPAEDELPDREHASTLGALKRVVEMQASFSTYRQLLVGGEKVVELDELRDYVAYPSAEQLSRAVAPRQYLAVRDAAIHTPFPLAQVDRLCIIDLPGLGELAPGAEHHHVAGLRDAVDLVILVKRPEEGMAFWKSEDAKALNVLDEVRGDVSDRRDFVFILLNIGAGSRPELVSALRASVAEAIRRDRGGSHYQVVEADGAAAESVQSHVLGPVLEHLAERLAAMDAQVVDAAVARSRDVALRLSNLATQAIAVLAAASSATGGVEEDRVDRTKRLREALAADLGALVAERWAQARGEGGDPEYAAAVNGVAAALTEYLRGGLGRASEDEWTAAALDAMRVVKNSAPVAADEFNRLRVEVAERFATIDDVLSAKVRRLWTEIATILRAHLGEQLLGLSQLTGETALTGFLDALDGASHLPESTRRAVERLLDLRLDFRTQVYPRVRAQLDQMNLEIVDPQGGQRRTQITVEVSEPGARDLYGYIVHKAVQATFHTRKAILLDVELPAKVLFAAAEQFEDSFIRAGTAERDFGRLARSYRDDIWPGVYTSLDSANARISRAANAAHTLRSTATTAAKG